MMVSLMSAAKMSAFAAVIVVLTQFAYAYSTLHSSHGCSAELKCVCDVVAATYQYLVLCSRLFWAHWRLSIICRSFYPVLGDKPN
jgi:hypothetical protein